MATDNLLSQQAHTFVFKNLNKYSYETYLIKTH